jgi:hypothetical protein
MNGKLQSSNISAYTILDNNVDTNSLLVSTGSISDQVILESTKFKCEVSVLGVFGKLQTQSDQLPGSNEFSEIKTSNLTKYGSGKISIESDILSLSNNNCNKNYGFSLSSSNSSVSSKKDLLMQSLIYFFSNRKNLDEIIPIIHGKSQISLRILDWFVTNYSKKNNTHYQISDINFIVYLDYKSQLKAYSKKQFDPFCRRERISFIDHDCNNIITTVGQLNFFRWAIENDIIKYIIENYEIIENDMNNSLRNLYKKKDGENKRRKRTELSISATKTVNKHNVSIIVQFD